MNNRSSRRAVTEASELPKVDLTDPTLEGKNVIITHKKNPNYIYNGKLFKLVKLVKQETVDVSRNSTDEELETHVQWTVLQQFDDSECSLDHLNTNRFNAAFPPLAMDGAGSGAPGAGTPDAVPANADDNVPAQDDVIATAAAVASSTDNGPNDTATTPEAAAAAARAEYPELVNHLVVRASRGQVKVLDAEGASAMLARDDATRVLRINTDGDLSKLGAIGHDDIKKEAQLVAKGKNDGHDFIGDCALHREAAGALGVPITEKTTWSQIADAAAANSDDKKAGNDAAAAANSEGKGASNGAAAAANSEGKKASDSLKKSLAGLDALVALKGNGSSGKQTEEQEQEQQSPEQPAEQAGLQVTKADRGVMVQLLLQNQTGLQPTGGVYSASFRAVDMGKTVGRGLGKTIVYSLGAEAATKGDEVAHYGHLPAYPENTMYKLSDGELCSLVVIGCPLSKSGNAPGVFAAVSTPLQQDRGNIHFGPVSLVALEKIIANVRPLDATEAAANKANAGSYFPWFAEGKHPNPPRLSVKEVVPAVGGDGRRRRRESGGDVDAAGAAADAALAGIPGPTRTTGFKSKGSRSSSTSTSSSTAAGDAEAKALKALKVREDRTAARKAENTAKAKANNAKAKELREKGAALAELEAELKKREAALAAAENRDIRPRPGVGGSWDVAGSSSDEGPAPKEKKEEKKGGAGGGKKKRKKEEEGSGGGAESSSSEDAAPKKKKKKKGGKKKKKKKKAKKEKKKKAKKKRRRAESSSSGSSSSGDSSSGGESSPEKKGKRKKSKKEERPEGGGGVMPMSIPMGMPVPTMPMPMPMPNCMPMGSYGGMSMGTVGVMGQMGGMGRGSFW